MKLRNIKFILIIVIVLGGVGYRFVAADGTISQRIQESVQNAGNDSFPAGSTHGKAKTKNCKRTDSVVVVKLNRNKYPFTVDHTEDAIKAGEASILHIDRPGAEGNRDESLAGIKTKSGHDRDEYPPAVSSEGGRGADIRYVLSSDNRGAGSSMGSQLGHYCDGQAFKIIGYNGPAS